MKPIIYVIATMAFLAGGAVTFAVIRLIGSDNPEIAFGVGAILATQLAAAAYYRSPGAVNTASIKLSIGITIAIVAGLFGLALHFLFAPFRFVEVSVPISMAGCFGFPFVLFDTIWNMLAKSKAPDA